MCILSHANRPLFCVSARASGIGVTGFGYYSNSQWHPFQNIGDQAAVQCAAAFTAVGKPCSEGAELVCHYPSGYPKKPCSEWCHRQDRQTARYTPPATIIQMNTMYGPWGHQGSFPSYTSMPAKCEWTRTVSTKINKVRIVTDKDGKLSHSEYALNDTETFDEPFKPANSVNIEVMLLPKEGPTLSAARLTEGCAAPGKTPGRKCFGNTVEENAGMGIALIVLGVVLALLGCCCCFAAMKSE